MSHPIAAQHRQLRVLFRESRSAFSDRDVTRAQAAFDSLRTALETHFDQEGRLYYPTIGALRPDLKPSLTRFVEAHDQFRGRFEEIAAALGCGAIDRAETAFEEFAEAFTQHEVGEEDLLRSLDTELASLR